VHPKKFLRIGAGIDFTGIQVASALCLRFLINNKNKNNRQKETGQQRTYRIDGSEHQIDTVGDDFRGRQVGLRQKIREERRLLFVCTGLQSTLRLLLQRRHFLKRG